MNVGAICTRNIVVVEATDSLQYAAGLMRENHVGALVVVERIAGGQQVVGIVTDRDFVVEVLARGADAEMIRVGQIAATTLVTIAASASIDEAIGLLHERGVRRLLVTAADGRLAGIVSLDDLLQVMAVQMGALAEVLRVGRARETAERGRLAAPDVEGARVFLPEAVAARPLHDA
jgi:CBS domain-containing protein